MKKGEKVLVYQDPQQKKDQEGVATLYELVIPDRGDGLELWLVIFGNDAETYMRVVDKADRIEE